MKHFRFSLQAVLTIRANEEQRALEAFAQAQAEAERIAGGVRKFESEINDLLGNRRDAFRRSTTSEELQQMQHGLISLQIQLTQLQMALQKAQEVLRQKSGILLEARKQREVVEKLRDKQFASFQAEVARTEQKVLDDFASMRPSGTTGLKWK